MNPAPFRPFRLSDDPPLEAARPVSRSPGSWMSGSGPRPMRLAQPRRSVVDEIVLQNSKMPPQQNYRESELIASFG